MVVVTSLNRFWNPKDFPLTEIAVLGTLKLLSCLLILTNGGQLPDKAKLLFQGRPYKNSYRNFHISDNIRLLHLEIYTNTFYRPGRILKSPLTVTRSIDVTSACSSFLTAGHETKGFHQIFNYFSIKCNSRHLAIKVAVKYDISIPVEISSNAVSASSQSHWLVGTS